MTSKVFSIFSVYDFVIVCSSVKLSSSGYSLGPETHEITVSKTSRDETFLRNHLFLAIFFHSKLGWREMNGLKETRSWSLFSKLTLLFQSVFIHSKYLIKCKIFLKGCIQIKAVSLGLYHAKFLFLNRLFYCCIERACFSGCLTDETSSWISSIVPSVTWLELLHICISVFQNYSGNKLLRMSTLC